MWPPTARFRIMKNFLPARLPTSPLICPWVKTNGIPFWGRCTTTNGQNQGNCKKAPGWMIEASKGHRVQPGLHMLTGSQLLKMVDFRRLAFQGKFTRTRTLSGDESTQSCPKTPHGWHCTAQ